MIKPKHVSDIFLSYARKDRERAKSVVDVLKSKGWSVFWDLEIVPGQTWDQILQKELDAACCVIVLWSRDSVKSEAVSNEAHEGKRRGILVPALIDDVPVESIPFWFRRIHAADLFDRSGALQHAGLERLLRAVQALPGMPGAEPAKALFPEWKARVSSILRTIESSRAPQGSPPERHDRPDEQADLQYDRFIGDTYRKYLHSIRRDASLGHVCQQAGMVYREIHARNCEIGLSKPDVYDHALAFLIAGWIIDHVDNFRIHTMPQEQLARAITDQTLNYLNNLTRPEEIFPG